MDKSKVKLIISESDPRSFIQCIIDFLDTTTGRDRVKTN
jgi:hypothetical protein